MPRSPSPAKRVVPIPAVDLRRCKQGDTLRLRDGTYAVYLREDVSAKEDSAWRHIISYGLFPPAARTHDGKVFTNSICDADVVEIVSAPQPIPKRKKPVRVERTWLAWAHACKDGTVYVVDGSREEARRLRCDGDRLIRVEIRQVGK